MRTWSRSAVTANGWVNIKQMENKNDAAFPREWSIIKQSKDAPEQISVAQKGLTKREYFAAKAMQGLLSAMSGNDNSQFLPNLDNTKYCADLAVSAADELLRALAKTEG